MNKKMYKMIGAILVVGVLFTGVVGISGASEQGTSVKLSDIEAWAVADNIEVERLFEDLADARADIVDAEDSKGSGSNDLNREKSYSYNISVGELAEEKVLWDIDSKSKALELEGLELYFELQWTVEEMGIKSLEVNAAQIAYDEMVAKYDLGVETSLNVDAAKVDMLSAQTAMSKLEYDYEGLILDLNQLTNRDIGATYVFEEASLPEIDRPGALTEELIDSAIELNKGLEFMYEEQLNIVELREIYIDLNDNDGYDDEIASTQVSIEEKNQLIEDEVRSIEVEVRTAYNSLLSSYDDLKMSELNLEKQRIELAIAKEELELGLVTESYIETLERTITSRIIVEERAQLSYYTAVIEYKQLLEGY